MLDIKFIQQNPEIIKKACRDKQLEAEIVDRLLVVDKERRRLTGKVEEIRGQRNKLTRDEVDKGREIKKELKGWEQQLRQAKEEYRDLMLQIPNIPDKTVPVGENEKKNKVVKEIGEKPKFSFQPKDHIALAKKLDLIDFERGVKAAGFRGYYLKNEAVMLEMGLMVYALKKLIKKGFTPFIPPVLLKEFAFFGTGHFPWGKQDAYHLDKDNLYLAGTAEVGLCAYHAGEILEEKKLPIKYTGFSPCFRREAGTYGKDTKGVYRIHQFNKVEQIVICKADYKEAVYWHEKLLENAEEILQELGLPYRVVLMCTGEMGEPQVKKYDIETWMPGRGKFGETHSNSIVTDFQSRRLNIRYRSKQGELKYPFMLNNTEIASPRILIAILENYQQEDGSVLVPKILQEYVGKKAISN